MAVLLVVIHNPYVGGSGISPCKTNAPLIVNTMESSRPKSFFIYFRASRKSITASPAAITTPATLAHIGTAIAPRLMLLSRREHLLQALERWRRIDLSQLLRKTRMIDHANLIERH